MSFLAVCLGTDQAESFLGAFEHRALRENRPNFDRASEFQARAAFGDGQSFIDIIHLKEEITSNSFLGFSEGAVRYSMAIPAGDGFAFPSEGLAAFDLA